MRGTTVVIVRYYDWILNRQFYYYAIPQTNIQWLARKGYITWNADLNWWDAVCNPSDLTNAGGTLVNTVDD